MDINTGIRIFATLNLLFKQLIYRALAEAYISESQAAELLGLPVIKFHQYQQRTLDFDPVTH
ncbi:MAG: hypothetical protein RL755_1421 [Pseudomonadota bacterium]|jgi:hypothetical protein